MNVGSIVKFRRGQPALVISNETLTVYGQEIVNNRLLEIQHANTPENIVEHGFFLTDAECARNEEVPVSTEQLKRSAAVPQAPQACH